MGTYKNPICILACSLQRRLAPLYKLNIDALKTWFCKNTRDHFWSDAGDVDDHGAAPEPGSRRRSGKPGKKDAVESGKKKKKKKKKKKPVVGAEQEPEMNTESTATPKSSPAPLTPCPGQCPSTPASSAFGQPSQLANACPGPVVGH